MDQDKTPGLNVALLNLFLSSVSRVNYSSTCVLAETRWLQHEVAPNSTSIASLVLQWHSNRDRELFFLNLLLSAVLRIRSVRLVVPPPIRLVVVREPMRISCRETSAREQCEVEKRRQTTKHVPISTLGLSRNEKSTLSEGGCPLTTRERTPSGHFQMLETS